MYAGRLSTVDVSGLVHIIEIRLRDYGYVDSFPVRDRYEREDYEREHDRGRHAAHLNIAGVPPVDLPLSTRPLPPRGGPGREVRQPGLTKLRSARERRPHRARHRTFYRRSGQGRSAP